MTLFSPSPELTYLGAPWRGRKGLAPNTPSLPASACYLLPKQDSPQTPAFQTESHTPIRNFKSRRIANPSSLYMVLSIEYTVLLQDPFVLVTHAHTCEKAGSGSVGPDVDSLGPGSPFSHLFLIPHSMASKHSSEIGGCIHTMETGEPNSTCPPSELVVCKQWHSGKC